MQNICYKTFEEYHRPADISETKKKLKFRGPRKNSPNRAILNSNLRRGTVHNPIDLHADNWNTWYSGNVVPPIWSKPIQENLEVPRNMQKLTVHGNFK